MIKQLELQAMFVGGDAEVTVFGDYGPTAIESMMHVTHPRRQLILSMIDVENEDLPPVEQTND
jgi:hypothetical protein